MLFRRFYFEYHHTFRMKILFTGFFDPEYARNRILRRGLEERGIEVAIKPLGKATLSSIGVLVSLLRNETYDAVLIGHSDDQYAVPVARLFSSKPVIWDAFYSLYDTRVNDRGLVSRWDPKAWWYWMLDWSSVHLATHVLFDTQAHAKWFAHSFGIAPSRSIVVYVGADTSLFHPTPNTEVEDALVGFYGKFIPLQGVPVIVRAAKLLEPEKVRFEIIGSGQTYQEVRSLAEALAVRNITFVDRVSYEELPSRMERWSIALGIFGTSGKAARVIPNKVYEAAASGKAIISRDSPALREVFSERSVFFSDTTPEALAGSIRTLLKDARRRAILGTETANLCAKKLTPYAVVGPLVERLRKKYTAL